MPDQTSPSAQPASDTIPDGFGSTWSNRCPRCGESSMSVVRPGKVQCDSEKCYQMDMMEEEQFKKEIESIKAVSEEPEKVMVTTSPELTMEGWQLAELIQQNKLLKDGLNRQILFIDAMNKYGDEIRMKEWSTKDDMLKAEAILYSALRSTLIPQKP